jgi:hypothetical protein
MYACLMFGKPRCLSVLGEEYTMFTHGNQWAAGYAVKRFKSKIIRRLSDRDNFMSWRKTHKMLMRLKIARKELRKLVSRVSLEVNANRKRMAKLAM